MNDFSPAEFLRREVFPRLDAVQANLLDGFDPKQRTGSGSYPLTCPACKAKEAFSKLFVVISRVIEAACLVRFQGLSCDPCRVAPEPVAVTHILSPAQKACGLQEIDISIIELRNSPPPTQKKCREMQKTCQASVSDHHE